ncbi:hypothetical protein [Massilia sp. NP310]|uniref:hypothetical protein n=1 Tax=Massilia sp. NP310 TaxID=2861282 RepID=UPI001C637839|nr:hypothetical protein [Massilia sp. NP310]QYG03868.1 hypothetical protein KY496_11050 [Massilia sp. NP310]
MTRTASREEQREQQLIDLTREKTASMLAAIRASKEDPTKLVLDCLAEYMADNQAAATLVRETLAGTNSLQGVITDLIWTEAEQLAERELAALQREARELSTEDRIHRYLDSVAA